MTVVNKKTNIFIRRLASVSKWKKEMGTKRKATEVVQAARGRLKGALRDVISVNDEEYDDVTPSLPSRGRPPKKARKEYQAPPPPPTHQSFIMKLFERSVDLAKYNESTSLYPICRAWMLNQPRSNAVINFKNRHLDEPIPREIIPDLLDDFKSGAITEIVELPAPEETEVTRIPSPLPFQIENSKYNIDLDYDLENPKYERNELLADFKNRWTQIKQKWNEQSKIYEEKKYGLNMAILEELYKK